MYDYVYLCTERAQIMLPLQPDIREKTKAGWVSDCGNERIWEDVWLYSALGTAMWCVYSSFTARRDGTHTIAPPHIVVEKEPLGVRWRCPGTLNNLSKRIGKKVRNRIGLGFVFFLGSDLVGVDKVYYLESLLGVEATRGAVVPILQQRAAEPISPFVSAINDPEKRFYDP